MSESSRTPEETGMTRRRLFGSAAAAGGLAAASLALPPNVRKALADPPFPPGKGKLSDIKHVVLLMQENRSFDHYFGTLRGVRGFNDPQAVRLPSGRQVWYQPDPSNPDGYLLPYRLNTKISAAQATPSLSHNWGPQHSAWNGGKMDNWVPAHQAADGAADGPYTMGYYTREDIPFQYALADSFTLLDGYHCSVMGPTGPNRTMWMSGTIDPNGLAGGPSLTTSGTNGEFSWTTYPERLQAAGVSWKFYHETLGNTGINPLLFFKQYSDAVPGEPLYDNAIANAPVGTFEYDVAHDQLPTVSWILPPAAMNEHPANPPAAGATFVASKIDALAANPEVWAKTVFILSYDENDGLFDHVVPPTPPAGTPDEFVTLTSQTGTAGGGLPVGLGFRVPCIIVSPWTVGGYVCSELADHTSQLKFLELLTGVEEPNISAWRRKTVGDLTSAFRFNQPNLDPPALPDTNGQYNLAQYEIANLPLPAQPAQAQSKPVQEPGSRPRIG
ncbi:MAG TPA: alkaline phosphatase family protein [Trebonia sp.]|jgi:phospholipase C|nr:alkaline phosphatase family protein [Trebonia sp.]